MAADRPEITFGSNVAVWRNTQGRTITIKPRQYQDKDGTWRTASGWNVSDVAHLAHCLTMALNHCLIERSNETQRNLLKPNDPPPVIEPNAPEPPETGAPPF